jgi:hypothetical protein
MYTCNLRLRHRTKLALLPPLLRPLATLRPLRLARMHRDLRRQLYCRTATIIFGTQITMPWPRTQHLQTRTTIRRLSNSEPNFLRLYYLKKDGRRHTCADHPLLFDNFEHNNASASFSLQMLWCKLQSQA